jgi:ATP-dependent Clp protease protease subunit
MIEEPRRFGEEEEEEEKQPKRSDMTERLLKTRTIVLAGPVSKKMAEKFVGQILLLEQENATEPIKVFINSPGGDVDAGYSIYDFIRFVNPRVYCVCSGLTASAAVIVLLAAEKEDRLSLPNSRLLIHQPSTGVTGTTADIQIEAKEILKIRQKINELISRETGQPLEKVEADTKRNYWISAEEACEYGLISRIVTHRDELK